MRDLTSDDFNYINAMSGKYTKKFPNYRDEIHSAASLGMVKAIQNYDENYHEPKAKFTSVAYRYMDFEIRRALRLFGFFYMGKQKHCNFIIMRKRMENHKDITNMDYGINTNEAEQECYKKEIKEIVYNKLDERERSVVENYYFRDKNLRQIGNEIGLSGERVNQIRIKAIQKLQNVYK